MQPEPEPINILSKLNQEQIRPDNRMRFDFDEFKNNFTKIDNRLIVPLTCLVMAIAYFMMMLSFNASRMEIWGQADNILYWVGMVGMYLPVLLILLFGKPNKREIIILIVLLGLLLYMTKIAYSPAALRFVDEQQQWRSAFNAFDANSLFLPNPILEISPFYPGLQNGVISIAGAAHVPVDVAGMIFIGVVRVMLTLALFLIYDEVTNDAQVAGLASLVYMTNPGYLVFNSYLVYQSLALPAIAVTIAAMMRWSTAPLNYRPGLMFVAITSILVTIMTHHVSSYMLILYLVAFTAVMWVLRNAEQIKWLNTFIHWIGRIFIGWKKEDELEITRTRDGDIYMWLTGLTLVTILMWSIFVAVLTINYLAPQFTGIINEFRIFLEPELASELAEETIIRYDENGEILEFETLALPLHETVIGIGTIVVTVFGVLIGVRQALRRWNLQADLFALVVVAGGFYFFVALRFVSQRGGELLSRTWAFTYIAMALFLTMLILAIWQRQRLKWLLRPAVIVVFCLFMGGNIAIGWPPFWGRLPGPYQPGAFDRSIDHVALETTYWVRDNMPRNSKFAADFAMHHMLGGYSVQSPVYGIYDLFVTPLIGQYQQAVADIAQVDYILVDMRITTGISPVNFYYAPWEYGVYPVGEPIQEQWLTKFEGIPEYDRIYDNGLYIIYDIRGRRGIYD
ncbi:MAG: hypothetical protein AAF846_01490 [Chloroflexota bacterium]